MEDHIFKHPLGSFTNGKFFAIPRQGQLKLVWDVTVIKRDERYNSEILLIKVIADSAFKAAANAISRWDIVKKENKDIIAAKRADNKKTKDGKNTSPKRSPSSRKKLKPDQLAS